jgi:hypothetical protein
MKKVIINIISLFIIVFCAIYLSVLIIYPIEKMENAIQTLSISIILSVFLAGAIHQLTKNEKS